MGFSVFPIPSSGGLSVRKSQTFTSSGTFTLPSGYGASKPLVVDLEICGGGGGGGGGAYNAAAAADGGGGGGSGVTTTFNGVSLTANATITIGAGGTGGAAGGGTGGSGASGGASNVNSTYYSPGGGGGGGGSTTSAARFGKSVISYGYFIQGGYVSADTKGPGGGGGSGGAYAGQLLSNPQSGIYYAGGIYGYGAMRYTDNTDSTSAYLASGADSNDGKGLGMIMNQGNSAGTYIIRPLPLQRGGGGGGSAGVVNGTYGLGGGAGTRTAGGLSGIRSQTTGSKNGTSATDAGCGGGGGGGSYNNGGAGGAGGNGAAGYITVYWWE